MCLVDNPTINFGRQGTTSCPQFTSVGGGGTPLDPWPSSSINDATTFTVDIGQSGGQRGYTAITGRVCRRLGIFILSNLTMSAPLKIVHLYLGHV